MNFFSKISKSEYPNAIIHQELTTAGILVLNSKTKEIIPSRQSPLEILVNPIWQSKAEISVIGKIHDWNKEEKRNLLNLSFIRTETGYSFNGIVYSYMCDRLSKLSEEFKSKEENHDFFVSGNISTIDQLKAIVCFIKEDLHFN